MLVNTYLVLVPIFVFDGNRDAKMLTTGNQLKAARALAGVEQTDLAELVGVNVNTIRNMEAAGATAIAGRASTVQAVQRAMEQRGIEFLNHGQPGVRLTATTQKSFDTIETEVVQYPEFLKNDAPPGAGG